MKLQHYSATGFITKWGLTWRSHALLSDEQRDTELQHTSLITQINAW